MEIEKHSIGFVPLAERYGDERRLFTIWFSINLSIVCLTVGTLGILAGLDLSWTLLALVIGNAIGTVFMAAHSAQGPHLGIPQMIQSRAQFGVLGAGIPLLAVIVTYTLYMAADEVVVKATIQSLIPVSANTAMIGFGIATLVVAFVGYELIHRIGVYLTVFSGLLFLGTGILLISGAAPNADPVQAVDHGFVLSTFMATLTQATAWSLTFGPYVADYSRYLRPEISTARTFWYTAMGNFLGATLIMCLGAYMAAHYTRIAADPGVGIAGLFGRANFVVKALIVFGVFQAGVMNLYSAYMSASTIFTGFRNHGHVSRPMKFLVMAVVIFFRHCDRHSQPAQFSSLFRRYARHHGLRPGAVECDQSCRLLFRPPRLLQRQGHVRSERPLWPLQLEYYRNLFSGGRHSGAVRPAFLLYRRDRAGDRRGYRLDTRIDRPGHPVLRHRAPADARKPSAYNLSAAATAGWVILPALTLSPNAKPGSAANAASAPLFASA